MYIFYNEEYNIMFVIKRRVFWKLDIAIPSGVRTHPSGLPLGPRDYGLAITKLEMTMKNSTYIGEL